MGFKNIRKYLNKIVKSLPYKSELLIVIALYQRRI